jgi:hypothetical protein
MTTRKRLEGALADWHPHPKDNNSLTPVVRDAAASDGIAAPVVRDAGASDDIADRFFDSAPTLTTPEPPIVAAEPAPRLVAIDSAAVRARRRYLMRYVAGAVSIAGVIGLAAIVRMTLAGDASAADTPRMGSAVAASLPIAPPPVVAAVDPLAPPSAPALSADVPAPAPPAADPPAADPPAPAAEPSAAAATPAVDATHESTQTAGDAKKEALRALERGRLADAIQAGEQSVALDPGDADAWLILGAAYQQQGHSVEARRCFTTCAAQAQRGPRGECRALLR